MTSPVPNRDLPAEILIFVGASCVVLGGLVAAFTGPLQLTDGSWLAAYLVLVCGVAQYRSMLVGLLVGTGTGVFLAHMRHAG